MLWFHVLVASLWVMFAWHVGDNCGSCCARRASFSCYFDVSLDWWSSFFLILVPGSFFFLFICFCLFCATLSFCNSFHHLVSVNRFIYLPDYYNFCVHLICWLGSMCTAWVKFDIPIIYMKEMFVLDISWECQLAGPHCEVIYMQYSVSNLELVLEENTICQLLSP